MTRLQRNKRIGIVALSALLALAIMILIGFGIYGAIRTSTLDRQNLYLTAHQVRNQQQFEHLLATAGGRTIVEGEVKTVTGVTHHYITGEYFGISVHQERYARETYVVTVTDGNGNTRTETRVRYVWRTVATSETLTESYTFMGQYLEADIRFSNWEQLDLVEHNASGQRVWGNRLYDTTFTRVGTIRTGIMVIPLTFEGAMFIDIGQESITSGHGNSRIDFRAGRTIEDIFESGMRDNAWVFFLFWIPLSMGAIVSVIMIKRNVWFEMF